MDKKKFVFKKIAGLKEQWIPSENLLYNEGQIKGLPDNPRFVRDESYNELLQSMRDNPEMIDLKKLYVYPYRKKFVTIAGNTRLRGGRELGADEFPCIILPKKTTAKQLRAYAIKDNLSAGEFDFDKFKEWDLSELKDFGVDMSAMPALERM